MKFGVNTFGLGPYLREDAEKVWQRLLACGVSSIEPCIAISRFQPVTEEEKEKADRGFFDGEFEWDAAAKLIAHLRQMGFEVHSFHHQTRPLSIKDIEKIIPSMKELGLHTCVYSCMESTVAGIRAQGDTIRQADTLLRENGLELLIHNHDMEWAPEGGSSVMRWLLENIPELRFELDIGWVEYAGVSSVEIMKKYPDRFPLLHIKEIAPNAKARTNQPFCTAPGKGILPLREILKTAKGMPLEDRAFVIDQDDSISGDIVADIAEGIQTIQQLMKE